MTISVTHNRRYEQTTAWTTHGELSSWRKLRSITLLLCVVAATCITNAFAAPAPAGFLIENRAEAVYFSPTLGGFETIFSNTTTIEVTAVQGATLEPQLSRDATPGSVVSFPHRLTNTGNITTTYELQFSNEAGDAFDLSNLLIGVDRNSNGLLDADEPPLASGAAVTIEPGETLDLIVTGRVPNNATDATSATIALLASVPNTPVSASLTDTVTVRNGAVLLLTKSATQNTAVPGQSVTYRLTGTNIGGAPMQGIDAVVDSVSTRVVLIRDLIPRNTTFAAIERAETAQPLYHLAGDPEHRYTTAPPSTPSLIDAIAFAFIDVAAGKSFELAFSVTLNANAGGDVSNTAHGLFDDVDGPVSTMSNTVVVSLPDSASTIDFTDPSYADTLLLGHAGNPLQVLVNASLCNTDATIADRYPVMIRSALSGDSEQTIELVETGPNTGRFTLAGLGTLRWPDSPQLRDNGIVEVARNDVVTARLESCAGVLLETQILIDPAGIVFNSRTNQPIAGASVMLIGIDASGAEFVPDVFDADGNPVSNQFFTGGDGSYEFPLVAPGNYRLMITPPNGTSFPSLQPVRLLSPDRRIDASGSYGDSFVVSIATGAVFLDIPLDPSNLAGLFVDKTVSNPVAELGESVLYTVRVTNNTGIDLFDVAVNDTLPAGFRYMHGSVRLDNEPLAEPLGAPGAKLQFDIDWIRAGEIQVLTYRAQIGTGAFRGDGVNRVQAIGENAVSNIASVKVDVRDGVFTDEAIVVGKIFVDCNVNHEQDPEELGIPGVRLFLEDGTFVISDAEGKYSFVGVRATTHTLKIDEMTLPAGSEMTNLSNRHAGDPTSRFVDVKRGELHRADFAEGSCSNGLMVQVRDRREQGEVLVAEVEQRLNADLRADNARPHIDPRSRPSSGVVGGDGRITGYTPLVGQSRASSTLTNLPGVPVRQVPRVNLEELVKAMEPTLGFVDLRPGDTVATTQINVLVKGSAATQFKLVLNGEPVPEKQVGQRVVMPSTQVQAWEYIAVRLIPGGNRLELVAIDDFGNKRGHETVKIMAPGSLGRLELAMPEAGAAADGHTAVPVVLSLLDDRGMKVSARTAVTLESTLGRWDVTDLNPKETGVQAFIEGGSATFGLLPPDVPGQSNVRVSSGVLEVSEQLDFLPDLRPLVVSGMIDGAVGHNRLDPDKLSEAARNDGFEEKIGGFSFAGSDGLDGGARTALFLKGKVRGDYLLTLSYDSDKDTGDRLFRDIRPDEFYPVYGDSAVKGFDAQSTSKLFVRVDKGRSYWLYGDYTTRSETEARRLGNYSRSFTGLNVHRETANSSMNAFASYDRFSQQVEEIPALGISGPYRLDNQNMVTQSEVVEIITRDRNQPALVLDTRRLTRFTDYSLDFFTGELMFREPVPSVDTNLNPISLRVSYELDAGGERFWVYGFDGQMRLGSNIEVGGSRVEDEQPDNKYKLTSANTTIKLGANSHVVAEFARTESQSEGSGNAARLELKHQGQRLDARVFAVRSDETFLNPNASVNAGRNEAGAKAAWRIDNVTRLSAEVLRTEDRTSGGVRKGALAAVERTFDNNIRAELGLRHVEDIGAAAAESDTAPDSHETTSARLRLDWQPPDKTALNFFTEYEQALDDSDASLAAIGGDYQITNRGRLHLRHEFLSSLSGSFGLSEFEQRNHNTVAGFDFDYMQDGHLFSEYRLRDALGGREAEAAIGLRNAWRIGSGWTLQSGFERVQPMSNEASESTAATGAFEYLGSERWKATGRLEMRRSDASDSLLNTLGVARKLSRDWSVLGQNTLSMRKDRATNERNIDDRMRVGLAYRETDRNRWNALARYEYKLQKNEANDTDRRVHVWSGHVNYQPSRPWTFSGRYAGKQVDERGADFSSDFSAHLLSGRVTYDISERFDIGVMAGTLFSGDLDSQQLAVGLEVGYLLASNLWLSAGYNHLGFTDDDLPGDDYTNPGTYLRFRFKFDESLFGWLQKP